jgi:ubiquinone/menaquinone biosynthesis C-methylase UbiE
VLNVYGGPGTATLEDLRQMVVERVKVERGLILDVACGPGTLSRQLASSTRTVYGVDISAGMLRQGLSRVRRDLTPNVHFARARVEALPFRDDQFDAAICGGALHLFADTVAALREIGRTMKAGATLAVTTFIAGTAGILRFPGVVEHIRQSHGFHVFELRELQAYISEAGFGGFEPEARGSLLMFSAVKRSPMSNPRTTFCAD